MNKQEQQDFIDKHVEEFYQKYSEASSSELYIALHDALLSIAFVRELAETWLGCRRMDECDKYGFLLMEALEGEQ